MRSIVAVTTLSIALLAACSKKPPPPVELVDAGEALVVDAGDVAAVVVAPPVVDLPPPMVIAGHNVPQPRGFRRAQMTDAIGSPQIEPWLKRGDIVLLDEAAFPPGSVDVGFASMMSLPPAMTADDCKTLGQKAAETDKGELVESGLLQTSLGPTCTWQLKLAAGIARGAIAVVEGRPLSITAAHAPGDEKTTTAWNDVVTGMRKTSP